MIGYQVLYIVCIQAESWLSNHGDGLWPQCCSFIRSLLCGTLSKALEKSRRIQSIWSPTSRLIARSWMESISWVSVDRRFLKPCWESSNNPSLSMCLMIWLDYVLHHFAAYWSQRHWTVVYWCTSVSFFEEWCDVSDVGRFPFFWYFTLVDWGLKLQSQCWRDLLGCFLEQSRWDLIGTGGFVWIEMAQKLLYPFLSYSYVWNYRMWARAQVW